MPETHDESTKLAIIEPAKGIKARALELMREAQHSDAEFSTELKLPFLRDLCFLNHELHIYMFFLVSRRRVHRVVNEQNTDENDVFIPEHSMSKAALKISQAKPFANPNMKGANSHYEALKRGYDHAGPDTLYKAMLFVATKLGMKPETGATKVKAEITGVYEALQFCLGIYNAGLTYYEQSLTERQKKQGELLIRMAQEYATQLSETMVDIEASRVSKQYMPDIESTRIAEQLVSLRVGSSREALKMALETVEALDLSTAALAEMEGEDLL